MKKENPSDKMFSNFCDKHAFELPRGWSKCRCQWRTTSSRIQNVTRRKPQRYFGHDPAGAYISFYADLRTRCTDITITITWPSNWAYEASRNPAVLYIGTETLLSGGTENISPKELNEFLSDRNSGGSLLIHCAARNLIHVGFTELDVQYAKTYSLRI